MTWDKWQSRDQRRRKTEGKLQATPKKGFLSTLLPFRQGLNWSKIIAVMSKGNLPQTEAGSSEAVAPGKAELLSFLKCQRGTGTGNTHTALLWGFLLLSQGLRALLHFTGEGYLLPIYLRPVTNDLTPPVWGTTSTPNRSICRRYLLSTVRAALFIHETRINT